MASPKRNPNEPELRQVWARPTVVKIEWKVGSPPGKNTKTCEVFLDDKKLFDVEKRLNVMPAKNGFWSAVIPELKTATSYSVSIVAKNEVGSWPQGHLTVSTAAAPREPYDLQHQGMQSTSAQLMWRVHEPHGCQVNSCKVTCNGQLVTTVLREPLLQPAKATGLWSAHIPYLRPGNTYKVAVTAVNEVGTSPEVTYLIATSGAPEAPTEIIHETRPSSIRLKWRVTDPAGLKVKKCKVQMDGEEETEIARIQDYQPDKHGYWSCMIPSLCPGKTYGFAITATNEVDTGPAAQHSIYLDGE